jgi:hypothetical protein
MIELLMPRLTIVTGADATHGASLLQLARSVVAHERFARFVIYDLGLSPLQRERIRSAAPRAKWRSFDFSKYPAYFDIGVNAGEYAWKPVIVREELGKCRGLLCWMDAGNLVRKTMLALRFEIWRHGFHSASSSGSVKQWTHPGMFDYFGLPHDWNANHQPMNAACVGFNPRSNKAFELCSEWARLAAIRECIAPKGSSRANHRQDQALLTVLALRRGFAPSKAGLRGYAIQQDVEELVERRKNGLAANLDPGHAGFNNDAHVSAPGGGDGGGLMAMQHR